MKNSTIKYGGISPSLFDCNVEGERKRGREGERKTGREGERKTGREGERVERGREEGTEGRDRGEGEHLTPGCSPGTCSDILAQGCARH